MTVWWYSRGRSPHLTEFVNNCQYMLFILLVVSKISHYEYCSKESNAQSVFKNEYFNQGQSSALG